MSPAENFLLFLFQLTYLIYRRRRSKIQLIVSAFILILGPVSEGSEADWQCQIINLKVEELFPSSKKLPKTRDPSFQVHSKSEIQDNGLILSQIQKNTYVNGESRVSFSKFISCSLEYLLAIFPTVTITPLFIYISK